MHSTRIGFAGTPEFAAEHLNLLLQAGIKPVAVYTQPDRPYGRGKKLRPSPVKALALANGLPVYQPENFKDPNTIELLDALNLDVLVVVAYGLILPERVLNTPVHGCINVHASLLPRWRGAAPIERAILAGDKETGISIMQMDKGLDTGPVIRKRSTAITLEDNADVLTTRLIKLGGEALIQSLEDIQSGTLTSIPQDHQGAIYANKLTKEEARIDWNTSAMEIKRKINAFFPRSPAYSFLDNDRIRITSAQPVENHNSLPGEILQSDKSGILVGCKSGCLLIKALQLPGKPAMDVSSVLNGYREKFSVGKRFMDQENVQ